MSILGPLFKETAGVNEKRVMLFVHPNPSDSSSWIYQMSHFSTWYKCIAVDLPGYGRSPRALPHVTLQDIARACWEAVDDIAPNCQGVVIVGCSIGSHVAQHMFHVRPTVTEALVLSGAGWRPVKHYAHRRVESYSERGIAFRSEHFQSTMSPDFARSELGMLFREQVVQRNSSADVESIINMFRALAVPDPDWLHTELNAPVLILSGSLDSEHTAAWALDQRLPDSSVVAIQNAGHSCHLEEPRWFNMEMIRFLRSVGHVDLPEVALHNS